MRTLSLVLTFFFMTLICIISNAGEKKTVEDYSDMTIVLRKLPDAKPNQDFVRKYYEKNRRAGNTRTIASTNNFRFSYGCLARGLCSSPIKDKPKAIKSRTSASTSNKTSNQTFSSTSNLLSSSVLNKKSKAQKRAKNKSH